MTTPISSTRWPLPVMVWLHGGAFLMGSGADYGAERMAAQGQVMVVTINYRLGAFGFFGFPGLEGSGQFGLLDQQAALAWVRRNAAVFGGDPANVTLFGESAGAISTALQLVSPDASGLFDKAILQSGSPLQRWERNIYLPDGPPVQACTPVEQVRALGVDIASTLGCRDLEELRNIPAADLVKLFPATQPAYGDGILPEDPTFALRAGRFHPRPLIWGGTRDEHRLWVSIFGPQVLTTAGELSQLLKEAYGERAQDIEQRYPISAGGPRSAWASIATDRGYAEPFYESFKLASRRTPLYAFEFADRDAPSVIPMPAEFPLGAAHATELGYLFDVRGDRAPLSDGQAELANQMVAYWTNFAASGDPNGPGLPAWPRFDVDDSVPATMGLEPHPTGCAPFDYAERHQYEFWATVR